MKRRHRPWPNNAVLIVTGFNNAANQTRDANAVRAAMHRRVFAIGASHLRVHRGGIFLPEVENMPHFNAARGELFLGWHLLGEHRAIVHLIGARIILREAVNGRC